MSTVLVIGGTGFLGRHVVETMLSNGHDITSVSRSHPEFPFSNPDAVDHQIGDRTDAETLATIAEQCNPNIVVDCAAFYPDDVRTAAGIFADADAYVYVSSGGVYCDQVIPKREDTTPLHECTPEQATDDSMASYPARKAEGDRIARAAADHGVAAMSVRPCVLYGPQSADSQSITPTDSGPVWIDGLPVNQLLHDYWIARVDRFDRIVVPGDGTALWHRAYVADVAEAIRLVAERGTPGEAYNVADQRVCTLEDIIGLIADALDTTVETAYASHRDLDRVDLSPTDFILYHHPATGYPHVVETCKIRSLGWQSTPVADAMTRLIDERIDHLRANRIPAPRRDAEEELLATIAR